MVEGNYKNFVTEKYNLKKSFLCYILDTANAGVMEW